MKKAILVVMIVVAAASVQAQWSPNNASTSASIYRSGSVGVGMTSAASNTFHVFTATSMDGMSVDGSNNPGLNLRNGGTIKGYLGLATAANGFFTGTAANDMAIRSESGKIHLGTGSGAPSVTVAGSNVGIGNTSLPAWESTYRVLGIGSTSVFVGRASSLGFEIGENFYREAASPYGYRYTTAGTANALTTSNGNWYFNAAPSGTAGSTLAWQTPFVINNTGSAGGYVGTFTASTAAEQASARLQVQTAATQGGVELDVINDANYSSGVYAAFMAGKTTGISMVYSSLDHRFATVGAERLRITAAGNVGIGTTSPDERLTVSGNVKASGFLLADGTPLSNTLAASSITPGTFGGSGNYAFTGNVGIGSTASSTFALDVNGAAGIRSVGTSAGFGGLTTKSDADAFGQLMTLGSARTDTYFGQVGANWSLFLASGTASNGALFGTYASKPLIFGTNNSERVRIDAAGNVGIGAVGPATLLEVRGAAGPNTIRLGGDGTSIDKAYGITQIVTNGSFSTPVNAFYTNHSNNARSNELFRIHSGETVDTATAFRVTTGGTISIPTRDSLVVNASTGNVGVGMSASTSDRLAVNGQVSVNGYVSATGFRLSDGTSVSDGLGLQHSDLLGNGRAYTQLTSDNGAFYLKNSSNSSTVALNSSGNSYLTGGSFGIGVTTPSTLFHVRGSSSGSSVAPDTASAVDLLVERSADQGKARMVLQGGSKATNGKGQIYLGNADEWDSTRIEGGVGKLAFYVRGNGAALDKPAMTISTSSETFDTTVRVRGNIEAKYQDVAEWVPSGEQLTPGTVVIINPFKKNEVQPSGRAYDTAVAGVVSAKPGVLLGEAGDTKSKIATTGRVLVRVDATKHPVNAGDLLVTSEKAGVAMVSEPIDVGGIKIHRPGTLIGKALESLPGGEGEILVLLSLQ